VICPHPEPFLECSSRGFALDRNNLGLVGLVGQIVHHVDGRVPRQIAVELVVCETLTVFALDVYTLANRLTQHAGLQAGQRRFDNLERVGFEMKLCWSSGRT